jgi:hypothetical protein
MKKIAYVLILFFMVAVTLPALDEFFDLDEDTLTAEPALSKLIVSGEIGSSIRSYLDDGLDSSMEFKGASRLKITAASEDAEAVLRLKLDWINQAEGSVSWQDLLEEISVSYFFDFGFLEAGYTVEEWGKGDGMHAADPVNPIDQSEGFGSGSSIPKVPVPLLRTVFYTGSNSLLEFVYVPLFFPIGTAAEGRWVPQELPDGVEVTDNRPEMSLSNFQGGARYTFSTGPADLGLQYFYGFMHEPGFVYTAPLALTLEYTRYHLFAAEAAVTAGPFVFRAEGGYKLTEDMKGDDPALYNHRIVYLGGFDLTLPNTELYLLAQIAGDFTLKAGDLTAADVDVVTGYGEPLRQNTLVVSMQHPFFRQKMNVRLSGVYMLEAEGYYIAPELSFDLSDNLQLEMVGAFYGGKEKVGSVFHAWRKNDYLQMGLRYTF